MADHDADALRLAVAFRAAFSAPSSPVDTLAATLHRAYAGTAHQSIQARQARVVERFNELEAGRHAKERKDWDVKRQAWEQYERLRAEHREITGRGWSIIPADGRPVMLASAAPADRGPSPLIRAMYGLG